MKAYRVTMTTTLDGPMEKRITVSMECAAESMEDAFAFVLGEFSDDQSSCYKSIAERLDDDYLLVLKDRS